MDGVSIVIPAFNEAGAVGDTVRAIKTAFADSQRPIEIIVVDDGSSDNTAGEAREAGAEVIRHPKNVGYGNAILTGIRSAKHPVVGITDADGTYPLAEIPSMAAELEDRRLDMLVGARKGKYYHGGLFKRVARKFFTALSEFTVGQRIPDTNSGLRVMRRDMVLELAPFLCGGFSFTTTITVIAMLTSRFVDYRDIAYSARAGASKVRYFRDTLRTAQILIMTILLFNPIKLYLLMAMGVLALGTVATALVAIFPVLATPVLMASAFILVSALVMGLGFLGEQRRASLLGSVRRREIG